MNGKRKKGALLMSVGEMLIFVGTCVIIFTVAFDQEIMDMQSKFALAAVIPVFILLPFYLARIRNCEKRSMAKTQLTAMKFLQNSAIWLLTAGWTAGWTWLAIPRGDLDPLVWASIPLLILPVVFGCLPFVRKINIRAFDEGEAAIALKAEKTAAIATAHSGILLLLVARLCEETINGGRLLGLSFIIYHIAFNLAGWYYFRKNEKELQGENI